MNPSFQEKVFGKWILAGEHAVLRGQTALVFPVPSCFFEMKYFAGEEFPLLVQCESEQGEQLQLVFSGILQKALGDLGKDLQAIKGRVEIINNIPLVGGMGASAALCVMVTKLLNHLGLVTEDKMYSFAKNLEHLFHGESSGVDIAATLKGQPILFKIPGEIMNFEPQWNPHWTLTHCGKRGATADCVKKVKELWQKDPALAEQIDQDMQRSTELAMSALKKDQDLQGLQQAILLARSCFERWGLVSKELGDHMSELHAQGAIATKPTGSGEGGFVLSLWAQPPTKIQDALML